MIDLTQVSNSTLIKNGKSDGSGMITPLNIVKDMVNLVFDNIEKNKNIKSIKEYSFIDICCKSGHFLGEIYNRLMSHPDMIKEFVNDDYRSEYILNRMLYGVCFRETDAAISTRNVYGRLVNNSNIIYIPKWEDIVKNIDTRFAIGKLEETFGNMKFDIVVGNPPYNNDLYLDFVQLGKKLVGGQHSSVCMITPAKWQAKGGKKNEDFRREIVPYMSDIVYYPCCGDVFDILIKGGISYYVIDDKIHSIKNIKQIDKESKHIGLSQDWHALDIRISRTLHTEKVNKIIEKTLSTQIHVENNKDNEYYVNLVLMYSYGGGKGNFTDFDKNGKLLVISPVKIEKERGKGNFKTIFSGTLSQCKAFESYINTLLIRFLLYVAICGNSVTNNEAWRFVPDPGKFDHIFTDQELYEKYGLTEEEIAIIESVIKERK